ncbi:MAG: hypothetical protein ACTSYC_11755 [Promethearchaeota archaeon]
MNDVKEKKQIDEKEIERKLDILWKNWESRRRCEKTHVPKFIQQEKNESN